MDDDERERLLERERLQIQMIRQLDLEHLEVEEVDYSDEDEDADTEVDSDYAILLSQLNSPSSPHSSAEFTFDTYITPLHTYLGGMHLYCIFILSICVFFSGIHLHAALFFPCRRRRHAPQDCVLGRWSCIEHSALLSPRYL